MFSRESLNRWIAKQEQVTIGQLADFDFVDLPAVDQCRHMIKAQPKQKLDLSIQTEYPALQTIVYHSKKINAIFGPLFSELTRQQEKIQRETGVKIQITKCLVRAGEDKTQIAQKYGFQLVTDINEIMIDSTIDVVVELIGKVHPAKEFITQALNSKKHVVTANKDLIAQYGVELNECAATNQVSLFYEASVAGGIPILRTITNNYLADDITNVLLS